MHKKKTQKERLDTEQRALVFTVAMAATWFVLIILGLPSKLAVVFASLGFVIFSIASAGNLCNFLRELHSGE